MTDEEWAYDRLYGPSRDDLRSQVASLTAERDQQAYFYNEAIKDYYRQQSRAKAAEAERDELQLTLAEDIKYQQKLESRVAVAEATVSRLRNIERWAQETVLTLTGTEAEQSISFVNLRAALEGEEQ